MIYLGQHRARRVPENSLGRQATIGSDHHDGAAPSVLEKPMESDFAQRRQPNPI